MKKIFFLLCLAIIVPSVSFSQSKKAEKDSLAMVLFTKAVDALNAKDFVIIVDTYQDAGGAFQNNSDFAVFMSYEKDYVFLQGSLIAGNSYTNRLTVYSYNQTADKKGNINVNMQVKGFYIDAKIELFMQKGNNNADVIITPSRGDVKRFSGKITPTAESKYFKRAGVV